MYVVNRVAGLINLLTETLLVGDGTISSTCCATPYEVYTQEQGRTICSVQDSNLRSTRGTSFYLAKEQNIGL